VLKYLDIELFQNHIKRKVEFDPEITYIIGPSDSGKSAIFRALKWVNLNQPNGSEFIPWDAEEAIVTQGIDEHTVTRYKGPGKNSYIFDKQRSHDAIGQGAVPEGIKEFLKVSDLNFQDQHSNPFWLSETPGEVSRQLNQIVNLEIIDSTLSNVAKTLSQARADKKLHEEQLAKALEIRADLVWTIDAVEKTDELSKIQEELGENRSSINSLQLSLESISRHKGKITVLEKLLEAVKDVILKGDDTFESGKKIQALQSSLERLKKYQEVIKLPLPNLNKIEELFDEIEFEAKTISKLSTMIKSTKEMANRCQIIKLSLETVETELNTFKMEGICPVCSQVIS
jgi:exonuclease SbcC